MKNYMIGVDIGTTSTKATIFDSANNLVSNKSIEYPLYSSQPGWAEQDPTQIFAAVINSIKYLLESTKISSHEISGVTFSSAMHSLIAMDKDGLPLTSCITWADNRSVEYSERLKNVWNGNSIYQRTGTPLHPMAPLSKILWFKYERPEIYLKTFKWISIKEYVIFQLFNKYIVDYSIASATGLFNIFQLTWDKEALEITGITEEQLSEPVPTTYIISGMKEEYKTALGLIRQVPFIIGASDGVLSNLGVGAIEKGVVAISIGTSGAVRIVSDKPVTDPKGRLFCYALTEDLWVLGGAINNGGIMLQWVRDELATLEAEKARKAELDPYIYLTKLAESASAGSEGLIFMPFLAGERAPNWNANARGVFFGLTLNHKKNQMIRAVLEGVIYRLYSVYLVLQELSGEAIEIRADGGFAQSALWSQIMADVFSIKVKIPKVVQSSAFGAVKLGRYAIGELDSLRAIEKEQEMVEFIPNNDNHLIYQELFAIYSRVYDRLKDEFKHIVDFQNRHKMEES